MTMAAWKSKTRRAVVGRILEMDPTERRKQEIQLARRLVDLPGFTSARTVLIHVSAFPDEVDTIPWLQTAREAGKRLVCPRVAVERRMLDLCEVIDLERDLVAGYRAIREPRTDCPLVSPRDVDWVLVPGLAFDHAGGRLGRGGGYYDRLLPTLRPDAPRWALILTPQWVEAVPREPHDCPVDGVADHQTTWVRSPDFVTRP